MTVTGQTLEVWQGTKTKVEVPIVDANGDPQDLTGATVWWAAFVDDYEDWAEALISKGTDETGDDEITLIQIDGQAAVLDGIRFFVVEADLADITGDYYHHEARGQDASGNPSIFFTGDFNVNPAPTRDAT